MEVRGGCGYIEEWTEPRLLRDAHLGSIWEGTRNIVALDVLRAIQKSDGLAALQRHTQYLLENGMPCKASLYELQPAAYKMRLHWRPGRPVTTRLNKHGRWVLPCITSFQWRPCAGRLNKPAWNPVICWRTRYCCTAWRLKIRSRKNHSVKKTRQSWLMPCKAA